MTGFYLYTRKLQGRDRRPARGPAGRHLRTFAEQAGRAGTGTLLGRLPPPAEVAHVATMMASDRASAMTGSFINVTCGSPVD